MSEPGGPRNHPPINGENGNPAPGDPAYDYDPPTEKFLLPDANNPPSFLSEEQLPSENNQWDPNSGEKPTRKQMKELDATVKAATDNLREAGSENFDYNRAAADAQVDFRMPDGKLKSGYLFRVGGDPYTSEGVLFPAGTAQLFKEAGSEEERNNLVNDTIRDLETHRDVSIYNDHERKKLADKIWESLATFAEMMDDPARFADTMHAMGRYREVRQLEAAAQEAHGGSFKDKVTARLSNRFTKALTYLPKKGAELARKYPKAALGLGIVGAAAVTVLKTDVETYIADTAADIFNDVTTDEVAGQPAAAMGVDLDQLPQSENHSTSSSQASSALESTGAGTTDTLRGNTVPPDEVEPDGSGGAAGQEEEPAAQTPPVEPLEITDEHREVTSGMGWNEKFKQLGVNPEYNDELLKQLGPDLEERGLAYWSEDAKEWRMKSLEDGMSDEDLQWIHEQAEANGFLAEQAPAPAKSEQKIVSAETAFETEPLGKFSSEIDPETGYMKSGNAYQAIATDINAHAQELNISPLDFPDLQQNKGFNEAFHRLAGETLVANGMSITDAEGNVHPDWNAARGLQREDTLKVPRGPLENFLTEQGLFDFDAPKDTDLTEPTLKMPDQALPDIPEIRMDTSVTSYEAVFDKLFADSNVPTPLKNPDAQQKFLDFLVHDQELLTRLYEGIEGVDAQSAAYNSYLSKAPFVPQAQNAAGEWFIHPQFIQNALGLMPDALTQMEEAT